MLSKLQIDVITLESSLEGDDIQEWCHSLLITNDFGNCPTQLQNIQNLYKNMLRNYILNCCQRFVMDKSVQMFLKDWNCKFLGSYANSFYAFKANIEISMLFIETC
jgi:hypothetical protein